MASVTVALTGYQEGDGGAPQSGGNVRWIDDISLGSDFDLFGSTQILGFTSINYTAGSGSGSTPNGSVWISILGTNNRFTVAFEATGRVIYTASDGEMLELVGVGGDMTEPYLWVSC